ncbi:MAG: universal stress protein [Gammaproteobacteria bacterium]|nr:universal stress protein [Gammaproteobacteria bacterium]
MIFSQESLKVLLLLSSEKDNSVVLSKLQELAEHQSIHATLLMCDYRSSIASSLILKTEHLDSAVEYIKEQHLQSLKKLASEFKHPNINYTFRVEWHRPFYESVLNVAKELDVDLVLKQTHEHSKLRQLLLTPGDYQLMKSCPSPVLLSKTGSWKDRHCIIAAVDPSHELSRSSHLDDMLIQEAKALSELLELPFKVCHVFDPTGWEVVLNSSASMGVMGQFVVLDTPQEHKQMLDTIREQHNKQLLELQSRHQLKDEQVALLEGYPEESLVSEADKQKAALIIVGTTYRSGLLGSTAEALLENINCDLVAIKHADFDALETH